MILTASKRLSFVRKAVNAASGSSVPQPGKRLGNTLIRKSRRPKFNPGNGL
jgi:hypothetical protein